MVNLNKVFFALIMKGSGGIQRTELFRSLRAATIRRAFYVNRLNYGSDDAIIFRVTKASRRLV